MQVLKRRSIDKVYVYVAWLKSHWSEVCSRLIVGYQSPPLSLARFSRISALGAIFGQTGQLATYFRLFNWFFSVYDVPNIEQILPVMDITNSTIIYFDQCFQPDPHPFPAIRIFHHTWLAAGNSRTGKFRS